MPCNASMNLKFDDILYKKINAKLEEEFNCTVPFLPAFVSKISGNVTEICKDPKISKRAHKRYYYLRSGGQSTLCDSPCRTMDMYIGLPIVTTDIENKAYIRIYLKSTLKVKKTVFNYDATTLLAELGGYLGMLLGISIANTTILINEFLVKYVNNRF